MEEGGRDLPGMKKVGRKNTKPWKMFENDIAAKAILESTAVSKFPTAFPASTSILQLESLDFRPSVSIDFSKSAV